MEKRITIAHFNESLDWVSDLRGFRVSIYHKNHSFDIDYDKIYICESELYLKNTGRESHTYLMHIYHNYDNLCDLEYFSQGNPFEHCFEFINKINNDEYKEYHHIAYDHTINCFCSKNGYITNHMKESGLETRQIWDLLFSYDPPEQVGITPFGLFVVTKEEILIHKKETYKKCLDLFSDGKIDNLNAWNLEYFWGLLFHNKHRTDVL